MDSPFKSNKICYGKLERAITKWGAIEKSPIFLYKRKKGNLDYNNVV